MLLRFRDRAATASRSTISAAATRRSTICAGIPVDRIKIDQNFIADIGMIPGNDAIVRAALGLARELSIEVVVEGVETAAQLVLLKAWGARIVQGYHFARPLPVPEATALLRIGTIAPADGGPVEIIAAA